MTTRRAIWSGCLAFLATLAKLARAGTPAPGEPIQVRITPAKMATITFKDVDRATIDQILRDVFSKREHGGDVLHVLRDARAVTLILISNEESKHDSTVR
jgi:hypothetical protein